VLPSEKAELWFRRLGYAILALMALAILVWLVSFVGRIIGRALHQRYHPAESSTVYPAYASPTGASTRATIRARTARASRPARRASGVRMSRCPSVGSTIVLA